MRPRLAALLAFSVVAVGAVGVPSALADPLLGGPADPVAMQADQLEVDVTAGSAVFTGNVSLAKGDLHVSCPRIEVKFDTSPHVSWARGSGGVAADVRGVHAEAPEVELDLTKQLLELRGGVRLTRGQGWLQAERASIDIATAKVTLTQVKGAIPVPPRPH
jgi:lipopolysaccharide export system protein LptA